MIRSTVSATDNTNNNTNTIRVMKMLFGAPNLNEIAYNSHADTARTTSVEDSGVAN